MAAIFSIFLGSESGDVAMLRQREDGALCPVDRYRLLGKGCSMQRE